MYLKGLILGLALVHATFAVHISSVISSDDGTRLLQYFKAPYKDLETAYYAISGLKAYSQGGAIGTPEKNSACKLVQSCDTKSLSSLYHAATVQGYLGTACKHTFSKETMDFVKSKISETSDVKAIFSAVSVLRVLGKTVDSDEVVGALLSATKGDNSVLSSSLALIAASKLANPNLASLLKTVDIEDMAAQADEVDERFLHFENDLEITSTFLYAVLSISEVTKQPLSISPEQLILFSNFMLRSKTAASSTKDAYLLLSALGKVASSSQISLVKAEVVSGSSISEDNPAIQVFVSNIFAQPITKLTVKADSVVRTSDNEVVVSNVPFKFDGLKNYKLILWKNKPKSGFYDVALVISSSGPQLIGVSDLEFKVKITAKVAVVNVEVGTAEREQTGATLTRVSFPKKSEELRADSQQKIIMKFQVKDLSDESLVAPHQAFVRFLHEKTGQEIIFVAEPDDALTYKFEVELSSAGREQFNSVSGVYSMHLIVGDAAISNPIFWNFGNVFVKLGDETQKTKSFEQHYMPKPEIHHVFRQPEERPPVVVSQAFTVACLVPIIVLFALWAKVGANLSGIRLAPKNILFHAGLAGIFILYYFCWRSLNMFVTVQYLCGIGAVTFVFGNFVLSDIANNRG